MALHLLFYASFTLMLGTLFNSIGPVIGMSLGVLFGGFFVKGILPPGVVDFTPWNLILPIAEQVAQGETLESVLPIIATAVWSVVFVGVAVWRFRREEL